MQKISDFLRKHKGEKLLAIMPHPDDVSFVAGGLFQLLQKLEIKTKVLCLTKEGVEKEIQNSFDILGVDEVEYYNYQYGKLTDNKSKWREHVREHIRNFRPELILTFDPHGITGHPDHIATSIEVLNIIKSLKRKPGLIWRIADDAERRNFDKGHNFHLAITPTFHFKLGVSESVKKLRAIFSHHSKFKSLIFRMQILEWYLFDHDELYYLVDTNKDKFNLEVR